ncbi:MAG: hypothetical protein JW932_02565 [Deltaproteobacteria bacterium]|nr:hypothetical protein [Deltaproteobacteria bacterium]
MKQYNPLTPVDIAAIRYMVESDRFSMGGSILNLHAKDPSRHAPSPREYEPITFDMTVPISAYPDIIASAKEEKDRSGLPAYIFSHAGDGNLHLKFLCGKNNAEDWETIEPENHRMVFRVLALGGTATVRHGVGLGKKPFMAHENGSALSRMQRIKDLFDPNGILNPDKIFP